MTQIAANRRRLPVLPDARLLPDVDLGIGATPVVHWALGIGLVLGIVFHELAPEFDILLAGLVGGTIAWATERRWRSTRAEGAA